jgi:hypothetical protein
MLIIILLFTKDFFDFVIAESQKIYKLKIKNPFINLRQTIRPKTHIQHIR